jgi:hypothetical protein
MGEEFKENRQILAEQIYQEVQGGDTQSSQALYQALYSELDNISDQAVDIMVRQNKMFE